MRGKQLLIPGFYFLLILLYYLHYLVASSTNLLNEVNFLHWDAEHYHFITEHGYDAMRCAFFPLFPFVWMLSGLNSVGISLLNAIIFIVFIFILLKEFEFVQRHWLIALSIPSFCFMFFPYTESLFFACSVLLILGWKKNNIWLVALAFFLSGLIRPAMIVFLPAMLLTEFFCSNDSKVFIRRSAIFSVAIAAGFLATMVIHFFYTGSWRAFVDAQIYWGNHLQLPTLPLRSWGGDPISRFDGVGLLVSFICLFTAIKSISRSYNNEKRIQLVNREVLFSLLYCAFNGLIVLLFRGGELFSLNRFVFATPFFLVVLLDFLSKLKEVSMRRLLVTFFVLSVWWLLFNSFVHIRTLLKYELLTLWLMMILLVNHPRKVIRAASAAFLIVGNIVLIMYFHHRLIIGSWVG